MITDVATYFSDGCGRCAKFATADCAARIWGAALADLRALCLGLGLDETVKWGHPCYMHAGRNIVVFGAFRDDVRLSFFHGGLMKDPAGILERAGPNSQNPSVIRFRNAAEVADRYADTKTYLQEAMGYAAAGMSPPKKPVDVVLPDELVAALDADPELAEAFHVLTPGRQRSYAINLNSAKKSETRTARIIKFRDKIIAGKGAQER